MSDKLKQLKKNEPLCDIDEQAWESLLEARGGCRCHVNPPCLACSAPVEEDELNDVGYTYGEAGL